MVGYFNRLHCCLLSRGSLPLDKGLSSICWYMNLIAIQEYEHPIYFAFMSKHPTLTPVIVGSSNGVVIKLLACWARVLGFDSRSHPYDFRDWLSPASKLRNISLKWHKSSKQPTVGTVGSQKNMSLLLVYCWIIWEILHILFLSI